VKILFSYCVPYDFRVFCLYGGAEFVARIFPDKKIDVTDFCLPVVESTDMQWAAPLWKGFREIYAADLASGEYMTYVLDTGTEVENICQQTVLEEQQDIVAEKGRDKQKLATTEYLARNLRMKALFDMAKTAGVNLITLQYLKEEWIREPGRERAEPTGKLVFDGWKRTESQADINLEIKSGMRTKNGKAKKVAITEVVSNRFDREVDGQTLTDATWDEVVALLLGE